MRRGEPGAVRERLGAPAAPPERNATRSQAQRRTTARRASSLASTHLGAREATRLSRGRIERVHGRGLSTCPEPYTHRAPRRASILARDAGVRARTVVQSTSPRFAEGDAW